MITSLSLRLSPNSRPETTSPSFTSPAHFVLEAGSGVEPFLLMSGDAAAAADGFAWNLSAIENSSIAFHGTRLLTLSACSTARDYKSRNGLEMDGLGMVAQQKDAEAALAALRDVNDLSARRLMSDFYDRSINRPAEVKPKRSARPSSLFSNALAAAPQAQNGRGVAIDSPAASASTLGYARPCYWAPSFSSATTGVSSPP